MQSDSLTVRDRLLATLSQARGTRGGSAPREDVSIRADVDASSEDLGRDGDEEDLVRTLYEHVPKSGHIARSALMHVIAASHGRNVEDAEFSKQVNLAISAEQESGYLDSTVPWSQVALPGQASKPSVRRLAPASATEVQHTTDPPILSEHALEETPAQDDEHVSPPCPPDDPPRMVPTVPHKVDAESLASAADGDGPDSESDGSGMLELYRQGRSFADIAARLWVHEDTVRETLARYLPADASGKEDAQATHQTRPSDDEDPGTPMQGQDERSELAPRADVHGIEHDRGDVLDLYLHGRSYSDIAEEIGVHADTVRGGIARHIQSASSPTVSPDPGPRTGPGNVPVATDVNVDTVSGELRVEHVQTADLHLNYAVLSRPEQRLVAKLWSLFPEEVTVAFLLHRDTASLRRWRQSASAALEDVFRDLRSRLWEELRSPDVAEAIVSKVTVPLTELCIPAGALRAVPSECLVTEAGIGFMTSAEARLERCARLVGRKVDTAFLVRESAALSWWCTSDRDAERYEQLRGRVWGAIQGQFKQHERQLPVPSDGLDGDTSRTELQHSRSIQRADLAQLASDVGFEINVSGLDESQRKLMRKLGARSEGPVTASSVLVINRADFASQPGIGRVYTSALQSLQAVLCKDLVAWRARDDAPPDRSLGVLAHPARRGSSHLERQQPAPSDGFDETAHETGSQHTRRVRRADLAQLAADVGFEINVSGLKTPQQKLMRKLDARSEGPVTASTVLTMDPEEFALQPGVGRLYTEALRSLQAAIYRDLTAWKDRGGTQPDGPFGVLTRLARRPLSREELAQLAEDDGYRFCAAHLLPSDDKLLRKLATLSGDEVTVASVLRVCPKEFKAVRGVGRLRTDALRSLQDRIQHALNAHRDESEHGERASDGDLLIRDGAPPASWADEDLPRVEQHVLATLDRLLASLGARGARVARARWRYMEPGATLKALGEECGVSRERIRQIEVNARERLREAYSTHAPALFGHIERYLRTDLLEQLPLLSSRFHDSESLWTFLDVACGLEEGSIAEHQRATRSAVDRGRLEQLFRSLPSPIAVDALNAEIGAAFGLSESLSAACISHHLEQGALRRVGDAVEPCGMEVAAASAHLLASYPNGLHWQQFVHIYNSRSLAKSTLSSDRPPSALTYIPESYLVGRGTHRHVMFFPHTDEEMLVAVRSVHEYLVDRGQTAYNLQTVWGDIGTPLRMDYFSLRYSISACGQDVGLHFIGQSRVDTVAMHENAPRVGLADAVHGLLDESDSPLRADSVATRLLHGNVNFATVLLQQLVANGAAVRVGDGLYTTTEHVLADVDTSRFVDSVTVTLREADRPVHIDVVKHRVNAEHHWSLSRQLCQDIARALAADGGWHISRGLFGLEPVPYASLHAAVLELYDPGLGREDNLDRLRSAIEIDDHTMNTRVAQWMSAARDAHRAAMGEEAEETTTPSPSGGVPSHAGRPFPVEDPVSPDSPLGDDGSAALGGSQHTLSGVESLARARISSTITQALGGHRAQEYGAAAQGTHARPTHPIAAAASPAVGDAPSVSASVVRDAVAADDQEDDASDPVRQAIEVGAEESEQQRLRNSVYRALPAKGPIQRGALLSIVNAEMGDQVAPRRLRKQFNALLRVERDAGKLTVSRDWAEISRVD